MKKYNIYFACPFEQAINESVKTGWQNKFREGLNSNKVVLYMPSQMEALKTGLKLNKHIDATHTMFINKNYKGLIKDMSLVWFGESEAPKDIVEWMMLKRKEKLENRRMNKNLWGDFEAVIKSDFIIARLPKGSLTVGTHDEILTAMLFRIPVYLIIPGFRNKSRSEKSMILNKTNYHKVIVSGGQYFWSDEDALIHIKRRYKL